MIFQIQNLKDHFNDKILILGVLVLRDLVWQLYIQNYKFNIFGTFNKKI